jgi:hypothetical protein
MSHPNYEITFKNNTERNIKPFSWDVNMHVRVYMYMYVDSSIGIGL